MHPNYKVVAIEIPVNNPEKMDKFQDAMDLWQDEMVNHISDIANKLNISVSCAMDVVYLRSRSRWSQENEDELIRLHSIGKAPNICDWP